MTFDPNQNYPEVPVTRSLGLTDQEKAKFSISGLIEGRCASMGVPGFTKKHLDAAGFELEVVAAAASKQPASSHGGDVIPYEILDGTDLQRERRAMRRDLSVGIGTAGGVTVAEDVLGGSFIDLLRSAQVTSALGATFLNNLQGDVAIPTHTGASTSYWISSEGSAPTESTQTLGQVSLIPRTLGAYTDMSRQLLLQSSIAIEDFVRRDLATTIALEVDRVALYGTGAGEPRGISGRTDLNTTSFAAGSDPTWAEVVDMAGDIASDNALMGNIAYLAHPAVVANMKVKSRSGSEAIFVATDDGLLNGYRLLVSTMVASTDLFLGNWADLLIGNWGGLSVLVDPFTFSNTGSVRIVTFQTMDVAVRHAQSFSLGS